VTPERLSYAVPPGTVAALAAGSVLAFVAAPYVTGPGRALFVLAGVAAAAETLRSLLLRPTLVADADGVTVATGLTRRRHPWPAVTAVGTLAPPSGGGRLRRRANALEIDLGDRLVVVPGYRLGAPVDEVAAELTAFSRNGRYS
jgi:hypothetical protein